MLILGRELVRTYRTASLTANTLSRAALAAAEALEEPTQAAGTTEPTAAAAEAADATEAAAAAEPATAAADAMETDQPPAKRQKFDEVRSAPPTAANDRRVTSLDPARIYI